MEWKIKVHRRALAFLNELPIKRRKLVEEKLRELLRSLEHGVIPYRRLDIRKLRGEWRGFLRLRIGDIRVIFRIDFEQKQYT